MKYRCILLGPIPPPMGGQAIITGYVTDILKNPVIINTNTINKNRILVNMRCIVQILLSLPSWCTYTHVYISLSRGKLSSFKDLLVLFFCLFSTKKVIAHLHGNDLQYLQSKGIYNFFLNWLYKRIDTCIYVTNFQKSLTHNFARRSVVIPNAVENEWANQGTFSNSFSRLLYVSVLIYSKGLLILLDSFQTLLEEGHTLSLDIAGSFDSDEYMPSQKFRKIVLERIEHINDIFGPNTIKYHGEVKGQNKIDLFTNADIFIYPTFFKSESFGLVLVEAMLSGCIVVASDEPFFKEVIAPGNFLFEKGSSSSLTTILKSVINKKGLGSIKKSNKQFALKKYSLDNFKNSVIHEFK